MDRTSDSLVTWTRVVYALHAFSLLTGTIGTATIAARSSPAGRRSSRSF